jgi:predicted nucleic acid-binding protein
VFVNANEPGGEQDGREGCEHQQALAGPSPPGTLLCSKRLTHHDESDMLHSMSKRLQVLFDDAEMRELQRAARAERMTVAEWVRQTRGSSPGAHRRRGPEGDGHPEGGAPPVSDRRHRRHACGNRAWVCRGTEVVILIDSNVPMYLIGADHPHKADAQRALERLVSARERLVTDAEVLQEILHRYGAIDRRAAIQPAFDALLAVVDEVLAVDADTVERAKTIVLARERLSARGALHVAVMERRGVTRILSFDGGFDGVPGIERLSSL